MPKLHRKKINPTNKKLQWEQQDDAPNLILQNTDDFFISYNPRPGLFDISFFESDHGGAETALVKNNRFYILNGDFRKDYEKLIDKGFNACFNFYKQNLDKSSSWSDPLTN